MLVLEQISQRTNNESSILLLDQYRSHMTMKVKKYAKSKNIKLIYIPVGMTSIYQPLDTTINGILKTKMIKSYSSFAVENNDNNYSYAKCLTDLMINIKEIKKGTIMRSFDCMNRSKNNNVS